MASKAQIAADRLRAKKSVRLQLGGIRTKIMRWVSRADLFN
jgi:hypothetical protein